MKILIILKTIHTQESIAENENDKENTENICMDGC